MGDTSRTPFIPLHPPSAAIPERKAVVVPNSSSYVNHSVGWAFVGAALGLLGLLGLRRSAHANIQPSSSSDGLVPFHHA